MDSTLSHITDYIRQLIETTQSVIRFDMFVVDENLYRIIGTGEYEKYEGLPLPKGGSTDYVVNSGKPLVINNPKEHEVCKTCPVTKLCYKEYSIIYPIIKQDKTIGAIAIGAFSEEMKRQQMDKEKDLLLFLKNMADFLSSKLIEKENAERLKTILNTVNEGIIVTDSRGQIISYNDIIKKIFHIKPDNNTYIGDILPIPNISEIIERKEVYDNFELNLDTPSEEVRLYVAIKPIQSMNCNSEILFSFRDKKEMGSIAYKLLADYSYLNFNLDNIIGISESIKKSKDDSVIAARSDSNVLIRGESGTGKELFARAIHNNGKREKKPFIAVNCAAIPENLLESELFGYEDGAFTGAKKGGKPGKFELANNGTFFLDEIGDLSLHLQPKLLRVIEYGEMERVGGTKPIKLNIRIVAATNRNLEKMIEEGEFREDLYYRLNVMSVDIPPLRERMEDILVLIRHFIEVYNNKYGKNIKDISDEAKKAFLLYNWPGNVRELQNAIEYSMNVEKTDIIQYDSVSNKIKNQSQKGKQTLTSKNIKQFELETIRELLNEYGYSMEGKKKVAMSMGISLTTLYRRLNSL
ncbi:sigma-54-dependent Fis family transcriptional regulator [Clostridium peptidivorans]|uniref:sigma-54-dependent Fis family transcriptional regulator n=1 Tax=Clostridium peptidivorans TaxID=100174 RepID=UPI000BE32050|nr:sigma 54-interacting transcriptional regulator [Clostridium peptidivorans]